MITGVTYRKQLGTDTNVHTLNELFQVENGHIAKYVHVRNDPVKNTASAIAGTTPTVYGPTLSCGSAENAVYPLLYGEAKTFDLVDPAVFAVAGPGSAVWFVVEISGCADTCHCMRGR